MPASVASILCLLFSQSAAAGVGATVNVDLTATRGFTCYDCTVVPVATAGVSGAVTMKKDTLGDGTFVAITNAMTATTSGTVARTTTIANATRTISATDVVRYEMVDGGGGGGANAIAYLRVIPSAIS